MAESVVASVMSVNLNLNSTEAAEVGVNGSRNVNESGLATASDFDFTLSIATSVLLGLMTLTTIIGMSMRIRKKNRGAESSPQHLFMLALLDGQWEYDNHVIQIKCNTQTYMLVIFICVEKKNSH